jgi:hypothetical protein
MDGWMDGWGWMGLCSVQPTHDLFTAKLGKKEQLITLIVELLKFFSEF